MSEQVTITCDAPPEHNWMLDGEPTDCWYWDNGTVRADGAVHGPYPTRADAFAAAEAANPGEAIG